MKKYSHSALFKAHLILLSIGTLMFTIAFATLFFHFIFGGGDIVKILIGANLSGGIILALLVIAMSVFLKCDNCNKFTNSTTIKGSMEIKALPDWGRLKDQIFPKELKNGFFKCPKCGTEYSLK